MTDTRFSLEWDSHNRSICTGLSSLQQNGEFVDMTLAADGHHVKVHQMILALASPYIKDLIASANCPHPVIFLNKVSYRTLCSILEYIYMGQTLVSVNDISELIAAAKELHIKGLEDVKSTVAVPSTDVEESIEEKPAEMPEVQMKLQHPIASSPLLTKLTSLKRKHDIGILTRNPSNMPLRKRTINNPETESKDMPDLMKECDDDDTKDFEDPLDVDDRDADGDNCNSQVASIKPTAENAQTSVQYTVSNQGSLQLILNRFLYFLYYQYRDKSRQWRCVDYRSGKCLASVFTKDNVVVRRVGAHNHPFHDKNILKKVRNGTVYSALQEAVAKSSKKPKMACPEEFE